jgi:hypothetical protein
MAAQVADEVNAGRTGPLKSSGRERGVPSGVIVEGGDLNVAWRRRGRRPGGFVQGGEQGFCGQVFVRRQHLQQSVSALEPQRADHRGVLHNGVQRMRLIEPAPKLPDHVAGMPGRAQRRASGGGRRGEGQQGRQILPSAIAPQFHSGSQGAVDDPPEYHRRPKRTPRSGKLRGANR